MCLPVVLKRQHLKNVKKIHLFHVLKAFDTITMIAIMNHEHFCPYLDEIGAFNHILRLCIPKRSKEAKYTLQNNVAYVGITRCYYVTVMNIYGVNSKLCGWQLHQYVSCETDT